MLCSTLNPNAQVFVPNNINTYGHLRQEAENHHQRRMDCFMLANLHPEAGQQYKEQAHEHQLRMEECNRKAGEILLDIRIRNNHSTTIDLHDFRLNEAIEALQLALVQKERAQTEKLYIITGRGSHSRGGVAKIRPAVIQYLRGLKYSIKEETEGLLEVS